eukprot:m.103877 g.103877  ORF g.103877 m.103877 type:complete len:265 (-) comp9082_c0_seq2:184-978(-)
MKDKTERQAEAVEESPHSDDKDVPAESPRKKHKKSKAAPAEAALPAETAEQSADVPPAGEDKTPTPAGKDAKGKHVDKSGRGIGKKSKTKRKAAAMGTDGIDASELPTAASGAGDGDGDDGDEKEDGAPAAKRARVENKKKYIAFAGNLPFDADEDALKKHFGEEDLASIRLLRKKGSNLSKGCAFLEFDTQAGLKRALGLHHTKIGSRRINVEPTVGGGGKSVGRMEKLQKKKEHFQTVFHKSALTKKAAKKQGKKAPATDAE